MPFATRLVVGKTTEEDGNFSAVLLRFVLLFVFQQPVSSLAAGPLLSSSLDANDR
jgi:hypothetical protein